jgi:hypothetical protein
MKYDFYCGFANFPRNPGGGVGAVYKPTVYDPVPYGNIRSLGERGQKIGIYLVRVDQILVHEYQPAGGARRHGTQVSQVIFFFYPTNFQRRTKARGVT